MAIFQMTRRPVIGYVEETVGPMFGVGVGTASIPMATPIGTGRPRIYGVVRWPQALSTKSIRGWERGGPSYPGGHRFARGAISGPRTNRGIGTAATVLTTGFRRAVIMKIVRDLRGAGGLLMSKVQAIYR